MKSMLVPYSNCIFEADVSHGNWLKCKRCKQVFAVDTYTGYRKTINYCPLCGQEAQPKHKYDPNEYENYYNEMLNG